MNRTAVRLLIAATLFVMVFAAGSFFLNRTRPGPSSTEQVNSGRPRLFEAEAFRGFHLAEKHQDRFSTHYTFTNAEQVLKAEIIPDLELESANAFIQDGMMGVEALYANALSDYPGSITRQVITPEKFRPRLLRRTAQGVTYQYFLLYANERFGYGVSSEDSVKFSSLLGWFYCERSHEVYKIRVFAPVTNNTRTLEDLFLSLGCL